MSTVPPPLRPQVGVVSVSAPYNTLAVVSLVAGIASYVFVPVIGALVAIITGHMARGQIRQTGEQGGGFALAGLILGYVHFAIVALVVGLILLVVLGVFGFFAIHPSG